MIMAKYPTHRVEQIVERIRLGVDRVYCNAEDVYADYCTWGGRLNAYKALHDHAYVATIYSSHQHRLTCTCGVVKYATHNWENVVVVLPGGQTMLETRCITCGYQ